MTRRPDEGPGAVVCAVDVGTGSARAGLFDAAGAFLGRGEAPIRLRRRPPAIAEHDADDIWRAVARAVREAAAAAAIRPEAVRALGFDATCSLVLRGTDGGPLALDEEEGAGFDTIAWFDHRAVREAAAARATRHPALASVGGSMSPEMQLPKLSWLKRHRPDLWARAGRILDLADFLTWRATGSPARARSTLVCKWGFEATGEGWPRDFLAELDLLDAQTRCGLAGIGPVGPGRPVGALAPEAAAALGLPPGIPVAAGLVDAYAGALAVLGPEAGGDDLALVAGTSSCVMALTREPIGFRSAWGPFADVVLPGFHAVEAGQSATGGLLDHLLRLHAAAGTADPAVHARVFARVAELRALEGEGFAARLHVLPDFHGNRAPLGDPAALGAVSGLALDSSFDGLCALYWRACVAIALGVRQILEGFAAAGLEGRRLHLLGGHTRNPLLAELYGEALGKRLVVHAEEEGGVLRGTAMAAAAAAGLLPSLAEAARAMARPGRPGGGDGAPGRYERDYRVFLEMQRQRQRLDEIAAGG